MLPDRDYKLDDLCMAKDKCEDNWIPKLSTLQYSSTFEHQVHVLLHCFFKSIQITPGVVVVFRYQANEVGVVFRGALLRYHLDHQTWF